MIDGTTRIDIFPRLQLQEDVKSDECTLSPTLSRSVVSCTSSPSPASCGPHARGLALRSSSLARCARRVHNRPAILQYRRRREILAVAGQGHVARYFSPSVVVRGSPPRGIRIAMLRMHQSFRSQAQGRSPVRLSSPSRQSLISTSGCWLDRVEVGGFPRDASTHHPTVVARDCRSGLRRGPPARPPRGRPPATLPLDYLYLR